MIFEVSRVYAVSSLIATIVCLTCSLLSIINNSKNKVNIGFSIVSFIVGIWSFFNFLMFMLKEISLSLNIGRIIYIFAIFLPPALFFFIFSIMNTFNKNTKLIMAILFTISFIFLLFIPSNMFIKGMVFNNNYYCIIPGNIYFAFIIYIILSCIFSLILILKQYKNTIVKQVKGKLKILILAFFVVFIALGAHILVAYDNIIGNIPHNIFTILFIILMFYSIYKYENLNTKQLIIFKIIAYIITYFVGVGIPLYIVFMYESCSVSWVIVFIISTLMYLFMIYTQIEIENFLLAKQNTYQKLLYKTSEGIVCKTELQEICHIVISLIIEMIKVKFIYIFIYDIDKMKYICLDTNTKSQSHSVNFDISDNVVRFIETKNKSFILNRDEQVFSFVGNDLSVVVPIIVKEKLIGFFFIGEKLDNTIYSKKDLVISNQMAVSIQNIWFLKINFKQQEKLVTTEKLAAIGGMADGLAHQIKNRLNNFSLIGTNMELEFNLLKKNFDSFYSKEEFIQFFDSKFAKFPQIIMNNVKQTLELLQNILGIAKPKENSLQFETFSLSKIIQQVEELVKLKHSKYRFLLSLDDVPVDDDIYAIKTQIQEVLFNFIDNAVEATIVKKEYLEKSNNIDLKEYKPEIKISLKSFSDKWQIGIEDNGIGIKQEDKIKLFSAFFTTKTTSLSSSNSGSGIGIYIAKRMIVEAHKGTIAFESEYGKGTSFIITLPKIYKK